MHILFEHIFDAHICTSVMMHIHMYICDDAHIIWTYVMMHIYVQMWWCTQMYICDDAHTFVHMWWCTYIYTYVMAHINMSVCDDAHICKYVIINICMMMDIQIDGGYLASAMQLCVCVEWVSSFFADFQMLCRARQLARTTFVSVTGLVKILPKIFPENIKRLFLSNFFSNLQWFWNNKLL
jgi:hypothetical protein